MDGNGRPHALSRALRRVRHSIDDINRSGRWIFARDEAYASDSTIDRKASAPAAQLRGPKPSSKEGRRATENGRGEAMSAPGFTDFFEALGRPVAYYPSLARLLGSVKAAILLAQLMYWTPRARDPEGWIYKNPAEFTAETFLTYEEQRGARKILRNWQVLEERYARLEHRLYFRVNRKVLNDLWDKAEGAVGESPFREVGKAHLAGKGKPSPLLPEITSESTSKNPPTPLPGGSAGGFVEVAVPEPERTARAAAWIDLLNREAGTSYRHSPANLRHIRARLAEGFTLEDAAAVVRDRLKRWKGTEQAQYLRPATVFGSKFDGYLQASKQAATLGNGAARKVRGSSQQQSGSHDSSLPWCAARCGVNFVKGDPCFKSSTGFHEDPAESRPQLQHVEER